MGCNCKQTAEKASKYTDDTTLIKLKGVQKLWFFLRKVLTIVLVLIVFIIASPFIVLTHICKGERTINISKIIKLFNVKKQ